MELDDQLYKYRRKELKKEKRRVLKREFNSTEERRNVKEGFNREFRALKRSNRNNFKQKIKKDFGV